MHKNNKKIKVAVIGHGHLGQWHLQKALSFLEVEVVAVVDHHIEKKDFVQARYPNLKVCCNLDEIIEEIEAAFVITPTSTHYDIVKKLLNHKKHVFCEKPLTESFDQARELKDLAQKSDCIVQVGHSERFHKCWNFIIKNSSILNEAAIIYFRRMAPFKGRALDVDVVADLMIHDLDLYMYLFKNPHVQKIEASGTCIGSSKTDHVSAKLESENAPIAHFTAGRYALREVREVEIVGKRGSLLIDLLNCKIKKVDFENESYPIIEEEYEKRDHLLLEHENFYSSILNHTKPLVGLEEGMQAVFLAEKIIKNINSSRPD